MDTTFKFNEDVLGFFMNYLACIGIVILTLGLGQPWALCKMERWKADNTTIDGKEIEFIAKGSDLFFKWILWSVLIIVTFGIYYFWAAVKYEKFKVQNTIFKNVAN